MFGFLDIQIQPTPHHHLHMSYSPPVSGCISLQQLPALLESWGMSLEVDVWADLKLKAEKATTQR